MKKAVLTKLFALLVICLSAQNLYVQSITGEQTVFTIVENPKITFGNGTVIINETEFRLNNVQKLSFFNTATSIVAINSVEKILVFPNPVSDELTLIVENPQGLNFRLFDMSGQQLLFDQIHSQTTTISMQNFRAGTYILHIDRNGQSVQSLQIVKTQ